MRHSGLDDLLASQAARVSPLLAYLVVTRLFDPDEGMRIRVVEALANILRRDVKGQYAPEEVRARIISGLSQLGDPGLLSLIEVGVDHEELHTHIAKLINFAPHTGRFLKDLAGDRSQRIRTYNFPQNRVTDHRINLTLYKLDRVLDGEMDDLIDALRLDEQMNLLQGL